MLYHEPQPGTATDPEQKNNTGYMDMHNTIWEPEPISEQNLTHTTFGEDWLEQFLGPEDGLQDPFHLSQLEFDPKSQDELPSIRGAHKVNVFTRISGSPSPYLLS